MGLKNFVNFATIIYMAIPRSKHTKSKRNKRRAHIVLEFPKLTACPKCGKPVLGHTVCKNCGFYKGREVIDVLKKLTKKEKKKREKEIAAREKSEKQSKPLSMEELSKK